LEHAPVGITETTTLGRSLRADRKPQPFRSNSESSPADHATRQSDCPSTLQLPCPRCVREPRPGAVPRTQSGCAGGKGGGGWRLRTLGELPLQAERRSRKITRPDVLARQDSVWSVASIRERLLILCTQRDEKIAVPASVGDSRGLFAVCPFDGLFPRHLARERWQRHHRTLNGLAVRFQYAFLCHSPCHAYRRDSGRTHLGKSSWGGGGRWCHDAWWRHRWCL